MKNKITLISRLRNEELLLPDFLSHVDKFCDEFFFFDDASTDNTVEILKAHPKTKYILENKKWSPDQQIVQTSQRKLLFEYAKNNSKNDLFLLAEPDERIDWDFNKLDEWIEKGASAVAMQLFDCYLTEDKQEPYTGGDITKLDRMWGPEERDIIFIFDKNKAKFDSNVLAQRQPIMDEDVKIALDGYVKHYSKGISVDRWNEDVEYYSGLPIYSEKWEKRRGKAIHEKSDFDTDLYTFENAIKNKINI